MPYHLDYETYSEANLKNVGAYRYACDPTTEILIFSIAKDGERPFVWDVLDSFGENKHALDLLGFACAEADLIYAHNAQFEAAISKYLFNKTFGLNPPKLNQWRCTAAMARRAAIPSSLEAAGEFLELDTQKDKDGKRLIQKFSVPRKPTKKDPRTRILPIDEPEEFKRFGEYCRGDTITERGIHKKLHAFELEGAVLDSFQFDFKMNDRGVPVNVAGLKLTDRLINEYTERMTKKFRGLTGFNPTQRAVALTWLRERGYPFDNLQAANVDLVLENGPKDWETRHITHKRELEAVKWSEENPDKPIPGRMTVPQLEPVEMTPDAFEALMVRSRVSYAAVKKVPTMLNAACPDGRVRGALLWSGAERTHRWAGRIIQPHNFRRPTFKGTEQAYRMLCDGADIDTIEMLYAPFLEVVASCIRHFIHSPQGELLQADFSSVEARAAPWLCGGQKKLEMFANDEPIYETMAAKIFGVKPQTIIDEHKAGDSEKRFIGKQAELGCTYNMGRPKFRGTCEGFGYKPSQQMVDTFKKRFKDELSIIRYDCKKSDEPFEPWDIKFPRYKWAKLRNNQAFKKFTGRDFSVWAYRKDGSRRTIKDPDNPTAEEWLDLTYDDLADRAVSTWRQDNPEIVQAWKDLDIAAKKAIQNPGKVFDGTDKIAFGVTTKPGFKALVMRLPSGHNLIYPKPKLVWKGEEGTTPDKADYYNIEIQFWGKLPMKSNWGWCKTYGGKLLENATQAICGDFMANGACNASRNGYDLFMLVHDEAIGPKKPGQSFDELCEHLCDLPEWAEGMPLAAEGNTIPFYKKT